MTMIQVGVLYFLAGVVGPLSIELTMGEGETAIWFVSTNWIWHPGIWYSKMLLFNPFRGLGWGLWFWCLLVAIQKVPCFDPNLVALSWWRPSWSLPWRPSWLPGSQWGGDNPGSHQLPDQASHGSLPRLWKVSSSPPSPPSLKSSPSNGVPDIFDSHCHILQPFQHSGDFLQEPLMLAALLVLQCFLGLSQVVVKLLLILWSSVWNISTPIVCEIYSGVLKYIWSDFQTSLECEIPGIVSDSDCEGCSKMTRYDFDFRSSAIFFFTKHLLLKAAPVFAQNFYPILTST